MFEVTNRCSTAQINPLDDHIAPDGRVMELLSEPQCEGLVGRLSADRASRLLPELRGVYSRRRFHVQPARRVVERNARHPLASPDRVARLQPAHCPLDIGNRSAAPAWRPSIIGSVATPLQLGPAPSAPPTDRAHIGTLGERPYRSALLMRPTQLRIRHEAPSLSASRSR